MAPSSPSRWSQLVHRYRGTDSFGVSVPPKPIHQDLGRLSQVVLGVASIGFAIVVLATPQLSLSGLFVLLAEAVVLTSAQTVLAGGRLLAGATAVAEGPHRWWHVVRSWGVIAVGLVAMALAGFAVLDPTLAETAAVIALAVALVSQGFGRVFQSTGVTMPPWLRGSTLATGVFTVALVVATISYFGFVLAVFAILVGVILLIGGIETVVAGVHPTDPRQFVLLKLILFSSFYGLILINWIDLPEKSVVPGYGIWLLLTYMAPFGVLLVFQGLESWPLAASLGLLVSLNNDLGYFFVGNLIFGYHVALGPWIAGQLGFQGSAIVTTFQGGSFSLPVASWMMGASIYLRVAVVGAILYYWWQHPKQIVARSATPGESAPERAPLSPLDIPLGDTGTPGHSTDGHVTVRSPTNRALRFVGYVEAAGADSSMTKFVMVPGAWLGAWVWKKVAPMLEAERHEVYPITLTGMAERVHLARRDTGMETAIEDVLQVVRYNELDKFVLVGHSFAGKVVAAVADRIPEKVELLVYLDAFRPGRVSTPQGGFDSQKEFGPVEPGGLGIPLTEKIIDLIGPDVQGPDREWMLSLGTPWPLKHSSDPVTLSKNLDAVKCAYILCTQSGDPVDEIVQGKWGALEGPPWGLV